jgi:hypothetical protein
MAGFDDKLKKLMTVVDLYKSVDKTFDGIEASAKNTEKHMEGQVKHAGKLAGKDGATDGAGASVMASPGIPPVIGANGMPNQPHVGGPAATPQVTNPGAKGANGMPFQPQIKVEADSAEGWKRGPFADVGQLPFVGGLLNKLITPAKMAYMGLPTVQQSVEYEYNRNRAAFAGMGGKGDLDTQQNNIRNMGVNLGNIGVQTSATDVIEALNSSRSLGTNIPGIGNSLATASNLTPGLGFTGAASALTGLNAGRNVNNLKVIGVQVRDAATGSMRELKLIIEDLWSVLNKQKRGNSAITKTDLHMSLQPGNALDSLLEQYFGNDPMTRKIVEDGLLAKASGVTDLGNQEQLSKAGVIPDGIKSKAKRDNASSNMIGQFTDSIVQGFEIANGMSRDFSNLMVSLSNMPLVKQLMYIFAGGKGFADTMVSVGNGAGAEILDLITGIPGMLAEGGPAEARNTYIVGEKGPELFVPHGGGPQRMIGVNGPEFFAPEKDGQVIPNDKLNFAGFMHEGGYVTTASAGGGHSHPNVDKGTPHKHGSRAGKVENGGRQLPEAEIRAILKRNGWATEADIENGWQIIKRESARKDNAENFEGADMSYGLFQINMKNDVPGNQGMGNRRRANYAKYGVKYDWDLYDPDKNARIAWDISSQGRKYWEAWSTAKAAGLDGRHYGHPRTDDPWYSSIPGMAWRAKNGITNTISKVVNKAGDIAGGVVDKVGDAAKGVFNLASGGVKGIVNAIKGLGSNDFIKLFAELSSGMSGVLAGARAEGGPVSASGAAGASGNGGYNVNYGGITIKIEGSGNWDEHKLASEIKKALDYDNLIRKAVSH